MLRPKLCCGRAPRPHAWRELLSRNTTWTMSREIELGLSFAATNYYDGQGFLVRRAMNKDTALDLDGTPAVAYGIGELRTRLIVLFGSGQITLIQLGVSQGIQDLRLIAFIAGFLGALRGLLKVLQRRRQISLK
jgi:hypothetical protein